MKDLVDLFIVKMEKQGRSKETLRSYSADLKGFEAYYAEVYNQPLLVEEVTSAHVEAYQDYLRHDRMLSPATINRYLNSIRVFLQYCIREGVLLANVAEGIEPVKNHAKEREYLDLPEVGTLIGEIRQPIVKAAVQLMAYSGLRVSECVNLLLTDMDFEQGVIQVHEGKGGKSRSVPLSNQLQVIMKEYLYNVRPKVDSLMFFANERTGSLSTQYINREIKEAANRLHWEKNVSAHTLRHSFASNLAHKEVNVVDISKLLGHANIKTTSIYMHSNKENLMNAVNQL